MNITLFTIKSSSPARAIREPGAYLDHDNFVINIVKKSRNL